MEKTPMMRWAIFSLQWVEDCCGQIRVAVQSLQHLPALALQPRQETQGRRQTLSLMSWWCWAAQITARPGLLIWLFMAEYGSKCCENKTKKNTWLLQLNSEFQSKLHACEFGIRFRRDFLSSNTVIRFVRSTELALLNQTRRRKVPGESEHPILPGAVSRAGRTTQNHNSWFFCSQYDNDDLYICGSLSLSLFLSFFLSFFLSSHTWM